MVQAENTTIICTNEAIYFPCRRILGEGSTKEVTLARDQSDALLTLKILKQSHLNYDALRAKMQKEASMLLRLNHRNIAKVNSILFGATWHEDGHLVRCDGQPVRCDLVTYEHVGTDSLIRLIAAETAFPEPIALHLFK